MQRIMKISPEEIEKKSFEMITEELGELVLDPEKASIIKRVIHTTADFEYVHNLLFSENVVEIAKEAFRNGACIITDTQMAKSGINKKALEKWGCEVHCFISDEDVAIEAKSRGTTRAEAAIDKALKLDKPLIFAVGNAPTALIRLAELMLLNQIQPQLIIGVPVGFVNVVGSKELIIESNAPYIVARGRKGGSNVAAAICNAILYSLV